MSETPRFYSEQREQRAHTHSKTCQEARKWGWGHTRLLSRQSPLDTGRPWARFHSHVPCPARTSVSSSFYTEMPRIREGVQAKNRKRRSRYRDPELRQRGCNRWTRGSSPTAAAASLGLWGDATGRGSCRFGSVPQSRPHLCPCPSPGTHGNRV